ncbi:hypothetical protein IG631_11108 [Alternaria alternata]|nr:hypothetical protein IG631_11108 [Alternaria alternata]
MIGLAISSQFPPRYPNPLVPDLGPSTCPRVALTPMREAPSRLSTRNPTSSAPLCARRRHQPNGPRCSLHDLDALDARLEALAEASLRAQRA